MADLQPPWYLSFADDSGWLGACLVRGVEDPPGTMSDDNPVNVAWRRGCNPGGEVMIMPITEAAAAKIPNDYWNIRLSKDDLEALGEIAEPGTGAGELVKGTPEELQKRAEEESS